MLTLKNIERLDDETKRVISSLLRRNERENRQNAPRYNKNIKLLQDFIDHRYKPNTFSFEVISDPHTTGFSDTNPANTRFKKALEDLPYLNPLYSSLVVPGDFADSGKEEEYADFFQMLEEYHAKHPIVALGNHDVRWQDDHEVYKKRYLKNNGQYMGKAFLEKRLYWDDWVEGYHFIVLNTELDLKDNAYLSKSQLDWLKETLLPHKNDKKPIFVIIHQTFKGTADHIDQDWIYDSKQYPENHPDKNFNHEEALKEILHPYGKQTFIFTGHVHNGRDLLKIYPEDYGYVVDLPSFVRADYGDKGQCDAYEVVVEDSTVSFYLYNYEEEQWIDEETQKITVE